MDLRSSLGKVFGLAGLIGLFAVSATGCGGCDNAAVSCDQAGQNCQICDAYGCHSADPQLTGSTSSSSRSARASTQFPAWSSTACSSDWCVSRSSPGRPACASSKFERRSFPMGLKSRAAGLHGASLRGAWTSALLLAALVAATVTAQAQTPTAGARRRRPRADRRQGRRADVRAGHPRRDRDREEFAGADQPEPDARAQLTSRRSCARNTRQEGRARLRGGADLRQALHRAGAQGTRRFLQEPGSGRRCSRKSRSRSTRA